MTRSRLARGPDWNHSDRVTTLSAAKRPRNPVEDAERLLVTVWGRDLGNLSLPVDPIYIAQQLGIKVYRSDLGSGVAGLLVKRAFVDPEIHLNVQDSVNRQRFTCAHELGHYIKRATTDDVSWESVDRRDALASRGTDPEEIYANNFAANLLMPTGMVRKLYRHFPPEAMAVEFAVSVEAMKNRLATLRFG